MNWRLGLDMGTNSLGWTVLKLNNEGFIHSILDMGVRIFHDGREPATQGRVGEPLAAARRVARGIRRNKDRRLGRIRKLAKRLKEYELDFNIQDNPYDCRAEAATHPVKNDVLGRALFHIGLRRGFKSNRKSDTEEENSAFKQKISTFRTEIGENKTLGQFLAQRQKDGHNLRFKGEEGDWYPDRKMYQEEFDKIKETQGDKHLSHEQWDKIEKDIFDQRPLKPVERGKCRFFKNEYRAHLGLPLSHQFRIIQEINNLQYVIEETNERFPLNEEQRRALFKALHKQKTMSWGGMRNLKNEQGALLFPKGSSFNFEKASNARPGLKGNITEIECQKLLGEEWEQCSFETQNDMIQMLYDAQENEQIISAAASWGISEEAAEKLTQFTPQNGTASVSRKFMVQIVPLMLDQGLRYDEAVRELHDDDGVLFHHSSFDDEVLYDELPYYGEVLQDSTIGAGLKAAKDTDPDAYKWGKIGNPTVHVALNQVRKLVNGLIEQYGCKPVEIHVELSRDLKNATKAREDINKMIAKNTKENKRRTETVFQKEYPGHEPAALDLKKIKLWEELGDDDMGRECIYTGRTISAAQLFNGEVEIEHILPFSRTLDDTMANKIVAFRDANRIKGNDTPFEARHRFEAQGWKWEDILARASGLKDSKRRRFSEDAMTRFEGEDENNFIARQLTDNAYISRSTQHYLWKLVGKNNVIPVNGQLTAMLRGKWSLNSLLGDHNYKERNDHRHHALDALVVALTERKLLQHVNMVRGADDRLHLNIPDLPVERDTIRKTLNDIIVSFKQDHSISGKFFNETAYGQIKTTPEDGLEGYGYVTTKSITSLSEKELGQIREPHIRKTVNEYMITHNIDIKNKNTLSKALYDFGYNYWPTLMTKNGKSKRPPIKRVRVLVSNQSAFTVPSAPYKSYAPNSYVCCDIYQVPKGKKGKWKKGEYEWKGAFRSHVDMLSRPDDNSDQASWKPHPAAKHVMRLYKNDMVTINDNGECKFMRVAGLQKQSGRIDLRFHTSTDTKQRPISISTLKEKKMKKVTITETGQIKKD